MNKLIKDYQEKYASLPEVKEDLIAYIGKNYKINWDQYDKLKQHIHSLVDNEITMTIFLEPHPSPRPRSTSNGHFYVKGAKLHKEAMMELVQGCGIICTSTEVDIKTYFDPPKAFNPTTLLLAEEGLIRPLSNGDWDNLAKTYCDMIQGILIINDNIITKGTCSKYYSIKPRIELTLKYKSGFDCKYNMRKVMNTKAFQELKDDVLLTIPMKGDKT